MSDPLLTLPTLVRPRRRTRYTVLDDSTRWERLSLRGDDIVISTPAKSGTTWMQGIVTALLWPDRTPPAPPFELIPWLDVRLSDLDTVIEQLDSSEHRRAIKTHSPADTIPLHDTVRYLVVLRHPLDAYASWTNHRRGMRPEFVEACNAMAAAEGVAPWPPVWDGLADSLIPEWLDFASPGEQLASWWPLRDRDNVLLVHYQDLTTDLDGEMRRIAGFLDVDVPDDLWPQTVARCRFDSMKASHQASDHMQLIFDGGADRFFSTGRSGRWHDELTEDQSQQLLDAIGADLDPDAFAWLMQGSLALGMRP
jgi:aryl sulfotransferase